MRTPHTHYRKGAHVFLILRDGQKLDDIFEYHFSGGVYLRNAGPVPLKMVRSMSFRRLRERKTKA